MGSRTGSSPKRRSAPKPTPSDPGTKEALVRAAWRVLREQGFRNASSRAIANEAGVNQALVFYHFGSVNNLLLAALDETASTRMQHYRQAVAPSETLEELLEFAAQVLSEDLDEGHMAVAAEMIAGGFADPELRPRVTRRTEEWIRFVRETIEPLIEGSMLEEVASAEDIAFGVVALAVGFELLLRLDESTDRVTRLIAVATRVGPLLGPFLRPV